MSKITPHAKKLVEQLCEAARSWGYIQDQGTGRSVTESEAEYLKARAALIKYIETLQRKSK